MHHSFDAFGLLYVWGKHFCYTTFYVEVLSNHNQGPTFLFVNLAKNLNVLMSISSSLQVFFLCSIYKLKNNFFGHGRQCHKVYSFDCSSMYLTFNLVSIHS